MSHEEGRQTHIAILRIKRKRTHQLQPLDALVFDHAEPSAKRRRSDRANKEAAQGSGTAPRGIFRFAETVSIDSFSTPSKTRSLRDRIQSFLTHPPPALSRHASSSSLRSAAIRTGPSTPQSPHTASTPGSPNLQPTPTRRKLPSALRALREASSSVPSDAPPAIAQNAESRVSQVHAQARLQRYRIIEKRRAGFDAGSDAAAAAEQKRLQQERRQEDDEIRRGLRPPRVLTTRDVRQKSGDEDAGTYSGSPDAAGLRIYDAIEEGEERTSSTRLPGYGSKGEPKVEDDRMAMDQFGDMLKEYLTLQESITPSDDHAHYKHSDPTSLQPASSLLESSQTGDSDNDFVYDVYYRDTSTAMAASATSVLHTGEGGWDVSSLSGLRRIGQLAGMQDLSDDEEGSLLVHENDVDPSSEEEDLADQDSNEENDYRNDYPSDEDPASDNFESPAASIPLGWREKRNGTDWDSGGEDTDDSDEEAEWSD
ncbi:hypothetical protein NBRC10512_007360 [Rhodotorula toruloides]|uniref:Probable RNA polymerase II nuclear localization protein SLC7A6OS n=2 Tax=Rhodotorula toruloides TaxID=5286 RepID=A0A061B8K4_RHOTO|nr:transcription factor Iwr1 [Rhodotorula toruloides NP11]EMS23249.1 transcription factor Iwr1 [Rhodotorula toruloides NP11]CDR46252.1 RHTO0S12e02080g1_1 [Rhodotorula toruloides]